MNVSLKRMVSAAVCLALCLVLPFLTGQIPQIGSALAPMHLPVLLAGYLCGPWWALAIGLAAPPLRFAVFGMPAFPVCIAMAFELGTYGLVCGVLYRRLPKGTGSIYASLVGAMAAGRVVWGLAMLAVLGVQGKSFTWSAFVAGAFVQAVPGIVLQIILIPVLVLALRRAGFLEN